MVQTKKMNESFFAKMLKELNVAGELIRARQDEKQALLDEFDSECKRFFFGKISRKALESSVKKTNKELRRLDDHIRNAIKDTKKIADRATSLASSQKPVTYRATLSGISGSKKKVAKKRLVKRKVAKRKSAKGNSVKKRRR